LRFFQNTQNKLVVEIAAWKYGDMTTKLCDYNNLPNAQFIVEPITSLEITADSFEVSPGLLNLICKDQFGGSASEDAFMHLYGFCEICEM
jgi:hypothetical protein